jgi:hypothetical protein
MDAQVESSRVVDRRRRTLIEESARLHKQGTIIRSFLNGTGRIGRERERELGETTQQRDMDGGGRPGICGMRDKDTVAALSIRPSALASYRLDRLAAALAGS